MNGVSFEDFKQALLKVYPKARVKRTKYGVRIRFDRKSIWYNYRGSLTSITKRLQLEINNTKK